MFFHSIYIYPAHLPVIIHLSILYSLSGTFGVVWKGKAKNTVAAIKCPHELNGDLSQILLEASLLAYVVLLLFYLVYLPVYLLVYLFIYLFVYIYLRRSCKHRNVVEMYGICIDIPRVYIISEWIEGMDLELYLRANGPMLEVRNNDSYPPFILT